MNRISQKVFLFGVLLISDAVSQQAIVSTNTTNAEEMCPNKCGPNKSCSSLSGTNCQATCDNPLKIGFICNNLYVYGCFCNKGFVKSKSGECISIADCSSAECNTNEEYLDCGPFSDSLTCENYKSPPKTNKICNLGCYCIEGYVKNLEKACIPKVECPRPA